MFERLRRGYEYLNKKLDKGRTSTELTRCATINLRTAGASFVTAVVLTSEGASPALVVASLGVSAVAILVGTLQKTEARFIRNSR